jgi:Tfp pilus assembly protein PilN
MIRIDLGKDELLKAGKADKPIFDIKLPPAVQAQLERIGTDLNTIIIVGAALAIAALFPLFTSQYEGVVTAQHQAELKEIKAKIDTLKQQIAQMLPFQRELESYEQQKRVITERLTVVRQLIEQRNAPVNILDTVGQSLPTRTWLTAMDFVGNDGGTISLSGASYSNEEISDFVDKLTESVYFNEVTLDDVGTGKSEDKVEIRTFSIAAKAKIGLSGAGATESRSLSSTPPAAPPKPGVPPPH